MYSRALDNTTSIWREGYNTISYERYDFIEKNCGLTKRQLEILFKYKVLGYRQLDIANELCISRQAVHKSLRVVNNKIDVCGGIYGKTNC